MLAMAQHVAHSSRPAPSHLRHKTVPQPHTGSGCHPALGGKRYSDTGLCHVGSDDESVTSYTSVNSAGTSPSPYAAFARRSSSFNGDSSAGVYGAPPPPPSYVSTTQRLGATGTLPAPTLPLPSRRTSLPPAPRVRRHDPYASPFASTPASLSPQSATSDTPTSRTVVYGIAHQPLVGHCRFVAWPAVLEAPKVPLAVSAGLPQVTIEQVRFELSAGQLRWLLAQLTGVTAVSVVETTLGSFVAAFRDEEDRRKAAALSRAVLFDQNGAWAPSSQSESTAVACYMSTREFRQRGQRLPRELMLVKPLDAPLPPPPAAPAAGAPQQFPDNASDVSSSTLARSQRRGAEPRAARRGY